MSPPSIPALNVALQVIDYAAALRGMTARELLLRTRRRPVARTRFAVCWALRQCGMSVTRIADQIGYLSKDGKPDHSCAIHAVRECDRLRTGDEEYRAFTDELLSHARSLGRVRRYWRG